MLREDGYLQEFIEGIKEIKTRYSISRIALAYANEGVSEFVMLPFDDCDANTLYDVNDDVQHLIRSLDIEFGFSVDVFTEVSACDLNELKENIPNILFI